MLSPRCAQLTGLPAGTTVLWPTARADLDAIAAGDAFFHYNILRSLKLGRRQAGPPRRKGHDLDPTGTGFRFDAPWSEVIQSNIDCRAIVLVADRQTIEHRICQRVEIESPELKRSGSGKKYASDHWQNLLKRVNLSDLYRAWLRELHDSGVAYILIDSRSDAYSVIDDEARLWEIVGDANTSQSSELPAAASGGAAQSTFNKAQIEALLEERRFAYQRIDLPYGLHTQGKDRSKTRDLVLPESLEGKSVLDVGPALGYFCFEAEARGAARVVGVEVREDRYQDAMLLKEIKGSNVEFLLRDIVIEPLDQLFDFVLLLNVVHHLKEPFRAIRQLASITREQFIIEFPTLADAKFRQFLGRRIPPELEDLPLVGASSLDKSIDQTFVFAPAAIRNVLLDHERLCQDVEIIPSPVSGRAIARCYK
jgi:SAM-dependent methyltransferase